MRLAFLLLFFFIGSHAYEKTPLPPNTDSTIHYETSVIGQSFNETILSYDLSATYEHRDVVIRQIISAFRPRYINEYLAGEREHCGYYCRYVWLWFKFQYSHGLVSNLIFEGADVPISRNLKKGIANLFQINMDRVADPHGMHDRAETTIYGLCVVTYSTWNTSETEYRIQKVIHTETCKEREVLSFGGRYSTECPECANHQNVKSSIIYDYWMVNGWLKKAECRSKYFVQIGDEYELLTETYSLLAIEKSSPLEITQYREYDLYKPTSGEDLAFTWEWGMHEEYKKKDYKGWMEITYTANNNYAYGGLVGLRNYRDYPIEPVYKYLLNNTNIETVRWSYLKQILMDCNLDELRVLYTRLYNQKKDQYIFQRGLASVGSNDTFDILDMSWRMGVLSPTRFAMLLKILQETDYPTLDILHSMRTFIDTHEEKLKNDPILFQSVYLSIGEVARALFSKTKDRQWMEIRHVEYKDGFIDWIRNAYHQSRNWMKTILLIKVMGNTGFTEFFTDLEILIPDREEDFIIRVEAIYALRLIKDHQPRRVENILMKVFLNTDDDQEIRMIAFTYLMHTLPKRTSLELILNHLPQEPNKEVAVFAYSTLESLSRSTVPCIASFVQDVRRNLAFTKKIPKESKSSYQHNSISDKKSWTSFSLDSLTVYSNASEYPVHQLNSWELVLSRNWYQNFLQIGYTQIQRQEMGMKNIMLHLRYKQADMGFIVVNKTTFDELINEGKSAELEEIQSELKELFSYGPDIKLRSMVPTPAGVPLTFSAKVSGLIADWFSFGNGAKLEPYFCTNVGYSSKIKKYSDSLKYELDSFSTLRHFDQ